MRVKCQTFSHVLRSTLGSHWVVSKEFIGLFFIILGSVDYAECGVRSAEWKMRSVENAEYGKCGVENEECGK